MLTPLRNEALKYFEIMVQQIAVVVLKKCKKYFKGIQMGRFLFSKNFDKEMH